METHLQRSPSHQPVTSNCLRLSHRSVPRDQRCDGEKTGTEVEQEMAGVSTLSAQSMSAERKALKSPPRSSGESASSEPGGPWNKGSVSRRRALSSETQSMTAELAMTSKIPHRGKASLASRCSELHPAWYHNKHRSEHVEDRVLNGSTQGEGSKQTQSQDILRSKNEMKHLFCKTNSEELTGSEGPGSAEGLDDFLGGTNSVHHLPTFDILSSASAEEEAGDDLLACWWDTYSETGLITFPKAVSRSSSASTALCHTTCRSLRPFSPQSNTSTFLGGALVDSDTSLPGETRQPRAPPLSPPIDRVLKRFAAYAQHTHQHFPECHSSWQTSQMRFTPRTRFSQSPSPLVNTEEAAGQKGATAGPTTSEQQDNLDAYEVMTLGSTEEFVHPKGCQAVEGGATAAQSLKYSNGERVWRPRHRLLFEEEEEGEEQCRICHSGHSSQVNPLISPCLCSGSLRFIHLNCLKKWIRIQKISWSEPDALKTCELCKGMLKLDPKILDLDKYCRIEQEQQQQEILNEMLNLQEAVERLIHNSLLHRTLLPAAAVAPPCPSPMVRIWSRLRHWLRRTFRRLGERRDSPSPEASST